MAKKDLKEPEPAMLMAGIIYSAKENLSEIRSVLSSTFGPVAVEAGPVDFTWSNYYEKEMGPFLKRHFMAFRRLVPQDCLADIKHRAMEIEKDYMEEGARRVNIDPGLLTLERLVLATTKNFTHRIYLGKGIFADLTLVFRKGAFRRLDWTYPDYRSRFALDFLAEARGIYLDMRRDKRG